VERTPIYTNKSIYSDSSLPINNQIDFCNVTFSYDKHKNIFKDFNLCIPPGQKIGIFGDSGSGKTSLTYLLLRLYNPTQGKIVLGNQNISNLSLEQLRSLFSYVPQHASLLHQSIYENIAFGKPGASRDEVYEAAHICLCEEFIELCENGYDTIIGEGGYKLSGGQLQRLAIARAFIKKAPIFILDEALSGVEPSLEKRILDSLCLHLKEHTFILTSHRTAGLLKMDRVIELQHGNIIQDRSTHIFSEKN
jgi:ATP-binding cassette subfamily B protein